MQFQGNGLIAIAATKTPLILGGSATLVPRILSFAVSTDGVPTSDQSFVLRLQRATALGTSTAVTPGAPDPGDATAGATMTFGSNCTVEPTYTSGAGILWEQGMNPRITKEWSAYNPRAEIEFIATASNGVGFQVQAAGGAAGNCKVFALCEQ
jgi:hypothetical protein